MNKSAPEQIMLLFSVIERGYGKNLTDLLDKNGIRYHIRFTGLGTASSDMMDILGLGSSEKDIVISFGTRSAANLAAWNLSDDPQKFGRGKGIAMMIPLTGINNLTAAMLVQSAEEIQCKGAPQAMKNEYGHSLILINVNRGYTEKVMQTAKKAGATGGTVIRARLADTDSLEQFYGMALSDEKEIVAILVPDTIRDKVMEDVNREFGMRTEAQAMICSLAVDKASKI